MSTGIEIDNPDHHPALQTEDYAAPSLTLVLPGDLGKDETVRRLAQARFSGSSRGRTA